MAYEKETNFYDPTEKPIFSEGVTQNIFFDLLRNRASFIESALTIFREENPHLFKSFVGLVMASVNRDLSLDWAISYYEIFSRSARKNGAKMTKVSKDVLKTNSTITARDLEGCMEDETKGRLLLEKQNEKRLGMIFNQVNISPELKFFWITLTGFRISLVYSGKRGSFIDSILDPTFHIAESLQAQREADILNKKFS